MRRVPNRRTAPPRGIPVPLYLADLLPTTLDELARPALTAVAFPPPPPNAQAKAATRPNYLARCFGVVAFALFAVALIVPNERDASEPAIVVTLPSAPIAVAAPAPVAKPKPAAIKRKAVKAKRPPAAPKWDPDALFLPSS